MKEFAFRFMSQSKSNSRITLTWSLPNALNSETNKHLSVQGIPPLFTTYQDGDINFNHNVFHFKSRPCSILPVTKGRVNCDFSEEGGCQNSAGRASTKLTWSVAAVAGRNTTIETFAMTCSIFTGSKTL